MKATCPPPRFSAYGLTFVGISSQDRGRDAAGWEEVLVTTAELHERVIDRSRIDGLGVNDSIGWASVVEGELFVHRSPTFSIDWRLLQPLSAEAMVHPYLA